MPLPLMPLPLMPLLLPVPLPGWAVPQVPKPLASRQGGACWQFGEQYVKNVPVSEFHFTLKRHPGRAQRGASYSGGG